jgi:hypothetical protein
MQCSAQFNIETQVCGCELQGNQCCNLDFFDIGTTSSLTTTSDEYNVVTNDFGNYTSFFIDSSFQKTNFNIISSSSTNCSEIDAFLFEQDGEKEPFAQLELLQISNTVCLANFTNLVSNDDLSGLVDLGIGFYTDNSTEFTIAVRENIIGYTRPVHIYTVDLSDQTTIELNLNIQINSNSIHNESCLDLENEPNIKLIVGTCEFNIDEMVVNDVDQTVRLDLVLSQAEYVFCSASALLVDDHIVYTYQVNALIPGCDYYEDYDDYVFTVSFLKQNVVNTSTLVDEIVSIDILEDSITLISCPEADRDVDVSTLVPMARMRFGVLVETSYTLAATLLEIVTASFGSDIGLSRFGDIEYNPGTGPSDVVISFFLETDECLWVKSLSNNSCAVDYLPALHLELRTTFTDSSKDTSILGGEERFVSFETNNASECPFPSVSNDVTTAFRATLDITDENGNENNFNLDNPMIIKIELLNTNLVEQTGISLSINEVIVNLDDEYIRSFDVANKITQMQLDYHPYYRDAHFCRHYRQSNGTCLSFYQETTTNWNYYLEQNKDELFDEAGVLKYCQDIQSDVDIDVFVFTPKKWVFEQFTRSSGSMTVTVTAFLNFCEYSEQNRRVLQDNDVPFSTIVLKNITVFNFNEQIIINDDDDDDDDNSSLNDYATLSTFTLMIIVLASVNGVMLSVALVFCLVYRKIVYMKLRRIETHIFYEIDDFIN